MPAPTVLDGVKRAFTIFAVPSLAIVMILYFLREFRGPIEAGAFYLGITVALLLSIFAAAKYWNRFYTLGFLIIGVFAVIYSPSVVGNVVPSEFIAARWILLIIFFFGLGNRFLDKF